MQHYSDAYSLEENRRLDTFERLVANFPDYLAQVISASANSVVTTREQKQQGKGPEDLVQTTSKRNLVEAHLKSTGAVAGDPLTGSSLFENFYFL
ncbi:unnamed protein product, partial [Amoebophrya sp. A25]|eukprot:GSA25T00003763001.1